MSRTSSPYGRAAAIALASTLTVGLLAASAQATIAQTEPDPACVSGWTDSARLAGVALEGLQGRSDRAWAVGGTSLGGGKRGPAVVRFDGQAWVDERTPPSDARDAGYLAVTTARTGHEAWAVGYEREPEWVRPLVGHRQDGRWTFEPRLHLGDRGGSLIDITVSGDDVWAAGQSFGSAGVQDPLVVRLRDGSWRDISPKLADGKRGTLAAIAVGGDGDVWAGGTVFEAGGAAPYLALRSDGGWERHGVPDQGDGSISDIAMVSTDDGWAVGHRTIDSTIVPLIWRWDGTAWTEATRPETGSAATILTSVAVPDDSALPWVAGTMWDADARRFRGITARWDGSSWRLTIAARNLGPSWMKVIAGDPTTDGWVAGLAGSESGDNTVLADGLLTRICESQPVASAGDTPATAPVDVLEGREAPPPPIAAGHEPASDIRASGPVDVIGSSGLPVRSTSWGSVVADFDGDGRDDVFMGRHGKRAKLFLDTDAGFVDSELRFKGGDRHGCAAADVDGSGLPDLYCTFGALRGLGIKANQLWLDPGGPDPLLHPTVGGAIEPFGRGRFPLFIDIDDDGQLDLLIGQEPNRPDGLVSANRAYLWSGPASFEPTPLPVFEEGLNPESMATGDVDGDGRVDVLMVHRDPRASRPQGGVKLYLNRGDRRFDDATDGYGIAWTGIAGTGIVDAALVALDDDDLLDLVLTTRDRVRTYRNIGGAFEERAEVETSWAVALATGDVDGDGDEDIYVLRDKDRGGGGDLMLINDAAWTYVQHAVPAVSGGGADDVFPIDHDQDGTVEFLALNGRGGEDGPVQLISFASE